MIDLQRQLEELRDLLSHYTKYKDIVDEYILTVLKDKIILSSYPKVAVLIYDNKDALSSKDKYYGAYCVDFRIQWFSNDTFDGISFSSFEETESFNDVRLHLHLYFKSHGPHLPSKLRMFDISIYPDTEAFLTDFRQFFLELAKGLDDEEFLGQTISFSQAK